MKVIKNGIEIFLATLDRKTYQRNKEGAIVKTLDKDLAEVFTKYAEGNIKLVGETKPMMPIPNKYAFTISRPGTPATTASEPMMGIVTTAIPDVDEMKSVKIRYITSSKIINNAGGM